MCFYLSLCAYIIEVEARRRIDEEAGSGGEDLEMGEM
jgi:hypothetical protein